MTHPDKIVLITGASSGIGQASALAAAQSGWGVCVGYRQNKTQAQAVAKDITGRGGWAMLVHLPLEDLGAIDRALSALEKESISLSALVLSGSPPPLLRSFLKTTADELENQWRPLVVGNQHLIAETWKRFFRKKRKGAIVAVLSEAMGPPPWPHLSAYVTARAALKALLECALAEFGADGLRISAISPDYTATPMLTSINEHVLQAARSKRSRFLSPEEVARLLVQKLESPPADPVLDCQSIQAPAAV